jgi:hypothetical protein
MVCMSYNGALVIVRHPHSLPQIGNHCSCICWHTYLHAHQNARFKSSDSKITSCLSKNLLLNLTGYDKIGD